MVKTFYKFVLVMSIIGLIISVTLVIIQGGHANQLDALFAGMVGLIALAGLAAEHWRTSYKDLEDKIAFMPGTTRKKKLRQDAIDAINRTIDPALAGLTIKDYKVQVEILAMIILELTDDTEGINL